MANQNMEAYDIAPAVLVMGAVDRREAYVNRNPFQGAVYNRERSWDEEETTSDEQDDEATEEDADAEDTENYQRAASGGKRKQATPKAIMPKKPKAHLKNGNDMPHLLAPAAPAAHASTATAQLLSSLKGMPESVVISALATLRQELAVQAQQREAVIAQATLAREPAGLPDSAFSAYGGVCAAAHDELNEHVSRFVTRIMTHEGGQGAHWYWWKEEKVWAVFSSSRQVQDTLARYRHSLEALPAWWRADPVKVSSKRGPRLFGWRLHKELLKKRLGALTTKVREAFLAKCDYKKVWEDNTQRVLFTGTCGQHNKERMASDLSDYGWGPISVFKEVLAATFQAGARQPVQVTWCQLAFAAVKVEKMFESWTGPGKGGPGVSDAGAVHSMIKHLTGMVWHKDLPKAQRGCPVAATWQKRDVHIIDWRVGEGSNCRWKPEPHFDLHTAGTPFMPTVPAPHGIEQR